MAIEDSIKDQNPSEVTPAKQKSEKVTPTKQSEVTPVKRIPVHRQKKFDYDQLELDRKNFKYHWTNASSTLGNNIERYKIGGWVQVMDKKGNPIKRSIGKSEEGNQYLMKIPIDIWREDQRDKLKIPQEIEESMGKKGLDPMFTYGSVKITSDKV